MRRRSTTTVVLVAAAGMVVAAGPAAAIPDGFVSGREHEVRIRPILAEVPASRGRLGKSARTAAEETIRGCEPAAVLALDRVPTTSRADDDPAACVVVGRSDQRRPPRLLLGPAYLVGSDLGRPNANKNSSGGERIRVALAARGRSRWSFLADQVAGAPLAFELDGSVIGVAPITTIASGEASITLTPRRAFDDSIDPPVESRIDQARSEEVIELGRMASMTTDGLAIFADAQPRVDERIRFALDCPVDEAASSVVLGCYTAARIFLLRVDRADLAGVMTVTAAHEMLHAVYADLDSKEGKRIDGLIDGYLAAPDPRVTEALAEYGKIAGTDLDDEAHSLIGTLVHDLPRPLERYYARYFEGREAVVDAFDAYSHVFDELRAAYERLVVEVDALSAELSGLDSQAGAAAREADRLFRDIESLRSQGRSEESNALVGSQNAAAARANSLAARYNSLVATYNPKIEELNNAAFNVNAAYESLTPIETPET